MLRRNETWGKKKERKNRVCVYIGVRISVTVSTSVRSFFCPPFLLFSFLRRVFVRQRATVCVCSRVIVKNMGVLLVSDGTAAVQPRMNLNTVKAAGAQRAIDVGNETNNNVNGLRDANSPMPTQVVGIINVVNDEPVRSWMPPPPKKKWIRHYLLGEPIFFYDFFSPVCLSSIGSRTPRIFNFYEMSFV